MSNNQEMSNQYPLTDRSSYSIKEQGLADGINFDQLMELVENKDSLTTRQVAIFYELSLKLNRSLPDLVFRPE